MTIAKVFIHPRSLEVFGAHGIVSELKTRGFDIPYQPGQRFLMAVPDSQPVRKPQNVFQLAWALSRQIAAIDRRFHPKEFK